MDRCKWCSNSAKMIRYHDNEWGIPEHDDRKLFEYLTLEAMQCGLSWNLVIEKREIMQQCFDNFDYRKVSLYGVGDVERIIAYPGMIRSTQKVKATIGNASCFDRIVKEYGSFRKWLTSFTGEDIICYKGHESGNVPASNGLSALIAKEMKKIGFKYMGPVTVYSFLQACGIINDHDKNCFMYKQIIDNYKVDFRNDD